MTRCKLPQSGGFVFWRVVDRPQQTGTGTSYAGLESPPSAGNVAHAGFHSLWGRSNFVAPLVAREIHFHSCWRGGDKSVAVLTLEGSNQSERSLGPVRTYHSYFLGLVCTLTHRAGLFDMFVRHCQFGVSEVARYCIGHSVPARGRLNGPGAASDWGGVGPHQIGLKENFLCKLHWSSSSGPHQFDLMKKNFFFALYLSYSSAN